MLDVDESELVAFFGVLPEEQPAEELEFFGAQLFVKSVGDLRLSYSLSFNFGDLVLSLRPAGHDSDALSYRLKGVESTRIESDSSGRSWLRARSGRGDEVAVAVEPTIAVEISGNDDAPQQADANGRPLRGRR